MKTSKKVISFILAAVMAFSTLTSVWAYPQSYNGLPFIMSVEDAEALMAARDEAKETVSAGETSPIVGDEASPIAEETFRVVYDITKSTSYNNGLAKDAVVFDDDNIKITAMQKITDKGATDGVNSTYHTADGTFSSTSVRVAYKFEPKKAGKIYVPVEPGSGKSNLIFTIDNEEEGIITLLSYIENKDILNYSGVLAPVEAGKVYYFGNGGYNPKFTQITFTDGEITNEKEVKVWTTDESLVDFTAEGSGIVKEKPVTAESAQTKPTLWLLGDSTGAYYDAAAESVKRKIVRNGFGMAFGYDSQNEYEPPYGIFDTDKINVRNLAISGISSKSFVNEEWYKTLTTEWKKGDYLLIAFGHNNEKADDPARFTDASLGAEGWNRGIKENGKLVNGECQYAYSLYSDYILPAVEAGVTPIMVTPIVRRSTSSSGPSGNAVHDQGVMGDYRQTAIDVAKKFGLSCIDNTYLTYREHIGKGAEAYGSYHATNEGLVDDLDNTHTSGDGARMIAYFMAMTMQGKEIAYDDAKVTAKLTDASSDADGALTALSTFLRSDIEDPRGKEYTEDLGETIDPATDFAALVERKGTEKVKVNDSFDITATVVNVPENGKVTKVSFDVAYKDTEVAPDTSKGITDEAGKELVSKEDYAKAVAAQTSKTIKGSTYKIVTINANVGSAEAAAIAEGGTVAASLNVPFVLKKYGEVTVIMDNAVISKGGATGNVDGDNILTSNDAAKVIAAPDDPAVVADGDVNGDGKITKEDSDEIIQMVLRASYVPEGTVYEGVKLGKFAGHFDADSAA